MEEPQPTQPDEAASSSDQTPAVPAPPKPVVGLDTLRPEFKEPEHGRYLNYLENALRPKSDLPEDARDDPPRNIALTGGYGVGKSSVLQEYARKHPSRTITISLSTVSPGDSGTATGSNAGNAEDVDASVSGQIQKSIVKQLLYSRPPASVPGSRFNRIEDFNAKKACQVALALLVPIGGAAYLADSLQRPEAWVHWNPWGVAAVWLAGATVTFFALVLVQRIVHNRFRIERFTAGPATIDVGGRDQTYFDRYLDEIVYFFQRTALDVVIFEDLDRFNDAEIFEQLRELNTILNSAEQLPKRPIRFVYAVRDSLFETAPDASSEASVGVGRDLAGEAPPSVRAKFFDLIIPMVPFATPRTARDLLRRALRAGEPGSDVPMERLLGIAAPFIQDGRLINNIGNEYRIFSEHVLTPAIDGMRPEALAAMVLYKNLNLADYEKIRTASSKLDDLEFGARNFVRAAVSAIDAEIAKVDEDIAAISKADEHADQLATALDKFFTDASDALEGGATVQYFIGGEDFSKTQMRSPEFWARLASGSENLTVRLNGTTDSHLGKSQLETALGLSIAPADWAEYDTAPLRLQRDSLVAEKNLARSASFAELVLTNRTATFKGRDEQARTTTFPEFALEVLGKGLGLELVRAGLIDWNYSLYVSRYIGDTTTAAALNFAIKYTQASEQNAFYSLKQPNDIPGLIVETGDSLFHSRSAFNVDIVDSLVADVRFAPVLDLLSDGADDSAEFINTYIDNGSDPAALVRLLAPRWPDLLVHLAKLKGDPSRASGLIDQALRTSPETSYTGSDELKTMIEASYTDMPAFTEGDGGAVLADALADLDIKVADLTKVESPLKEALAERGAFKLNTDNLRIANGGSLAIEGMVDNERLLGHVLFNFDDYEDALAIADEPSIEDQEEIGRVLSIVAGVDADRVEAIAARAAEGLVVTDLETLNQQAWAGAMAAGRIPLTIPNLTSYLDRFALNEELVRAIEASPSALLDEPVEDESERVPLAREVLNDDRLPVSARVSFVQSMMFDEPFAVGRFTVTDGELMGELVHANLIPDTAATFSAIAALSWESKEHYIAKSAGFPSYIHEVALTDGDISAMIASEVVPVAVTDRLVLDIANLTVTLGSQGAQHLMQYARIHGLNFDLAGLRMLADAPAESTELLTAISSSHSGLDIAELTELLDRVGGDAAALTERGSRPLDVPEVPGLVPLLSRLKDDELVSSWADEPEDGKRKVHMRR